MENLRLCPHLVPEHGSRVQFSLRTNVNTTAFHQLFTPLSLSTRALIQGLDLNLVTCLNATLFGAGAKEA